MDAMMQVPASAEKMDAAAGGMISLSGDSIEAVTEELLSAAAAMKASDLFLCTNEQCVMVHVRHMGMVRPLTVMPADQGKRVITLIKARALMDLAERRRPQEGRWIFQHAQAGKPEAVHDLRISTIPTAFGEDMALRLLDRTNTLFTLDNLGLTKGQRGKLSAVLDSPGGLVLFTGPTGSGKTATMYTCLRQLNNGKRKINTIEDPIEYAVDGVRQSQVNPAIGLGFSELLRSVMRQAPDVIMIGEIRDPETASIAIRAANSGHLVLATIHAVAAVGAVQSMRAMGVHAHFLATALRCIVAQRLVRTLCPACKTYFDLADAPHTFDEIREYLGEGEGKLLWAARGCGKCMMSGYAGRTGMFEIMPISREIRNLISEGHSVQEIRERAGAEKLLEFRHAALLKVAHGETSTEEIFRTIPAEQLVVGE